MTSRPEHRARAGFVLPVVMVCGLLAISMVVTFQFVSSSDYKQVGRLMRAAQATALADLAGDEVAAKLQAIKWVPGEARPAWVPGLLGALDGAKAAPTIAVTQDLGDMLADCPVAQAQAAKSGLVKLDSVRGTAGPFQVLPAGGIDKSFVYKEDLYHDAGKDLTAWDLRGPISMEIKVGGVGGPLEFARAYRRGQTLAITDTTPPGREFAVMAYLPPFSADYAVADLQKGGTYKLNATATGRMMFRGPLVLVPEEADPAPGFTDKGWMGGTDPIITGTSLTYPDTKYVAGTATIPGPRELQHPASASGSAVADLAGVDATLFDVQHDMQSRRAGGEKSDATLKTKPTPLSLELDTTLRSPCPETKHINFTIPSLTFTLGEISPVLAKDLDGATPAFDTVDKEPLAYFPPLAYFYAALPKGQQKFQFAPSTPAQTSTNPYKGIKVALGGASADLNTAALAEGDALTTEPVPHATSANTQDNVGLISVFGVAIAESRTYVNIDVMDLAKWLVQKAIDKDPHGGDHPVESAAGGGIGGAILGSIAGAACGNPTRREIAQHNKDTIAQQALSQLGIDPSVKFLLRRYKVEGGLTLGGSISASQLAGQLSSKKGALAPYGSYYHDTNFWNSANVSLAANQAIKKLKEPLYPLTNQADKEAKLTLLLPETGGSPIASIDAGFPDASSDGKTVRDFLTDDWCKKLLAMTPASGASDPGAALTALTAVASKVRGIAEPRVGVKPRPQGAFGPYAGANPDPFPDKGELAALYGRGCVPSKARDWEAMATRSYDTFDEYYAAEQKGGVLELRGAVLLKACSTTQNVNYTGRGVIIVCTTDPSAPAKLAGTVTPQGAGSWLTLVHRVKPSLVTGTPPALALGTVFKGTVLSETGVKPAGGSLALEGSLIAGLLNKGASSDGDSVTVNYAQDTVGTMKDAWTVESTGEVSSTDPEP